MSALSLSCSDEKCNLCLKRGASFVINYKSEDFVEAVNGLTKVQKLSAFCARSVLTVLVAIDCNHAMHVSFFDCTLLQSSARWRSMHAKQAGHS